MGVLEDEEHGQPDREVDPDAENSDHSQHSHPDEKTTDPNIVDWDGPDDPANPRNWKVSKKIYNIALISVMVFVVPLASSMFAPAVTEVMIEFQNFNLELASFIVSVFVLGFAFGPLLFAPLSEIYGRLPLYWMCNVLFFVFTIACAKSTSIGMLTGFRFLGGFFGGLPMAVGGGSITDMMEQKHRGAAMALFSLGPLLGPIVGPIIGGFLAQAEGWRWVFWLIAILSGVCTICVVLFMSESYAPVLLEKKARQLRKSTGNPDLRSALDTGIPISTRLKHGLIRPIKLLFFSPVAAALSLFQAFAFGCMYLLFTTFTMVYGEVYNWKIGLQGLSFLGLGVGCTLGMVAFGATSDRIMQAKARANGGEMKPEYRLVLLMPAAFCIPIGLFWYGWTAEKHAHWILPILGTVWIGIGFVACMVTVISYMMDAFTEFSASAVAAVAVVRSIFGGCLPLAGRQMYESMGYGWGTSLLGFISIALLPLPFLFYRYGEYLRKRFDVNLR